MTPSIKGLAIVLSWTAISLLVTFWTGIESPIARLVVFVLAFCGCLIISFVVIEVWRTFRQACSALEDKRQ